MRSGLAARSSTLTLRGDAISMSFGFARLAPPRRCERLENETHFLRFRSLTRSKPPQTISASFMGPSPSLGFSQRSGFAGHQFLGIVVHRDGSALGGGSGSGIFRQGILHHIDAFP